MVDTQDGYLHVRMSRFPELLFVGNRAILGPGSYPTDTMVGVGTFSRGIDLRRRLHSGRDAATTVFGVPPLLLPTRGDDATKVRR